MSFPRLAAARLVELAQHFPAVIVTGARQVGKTTLARETFPGLPSVSLDLPSLADQAERDPAVFFANHPGPLVIDEVQRAPGLFIHLKAEIDRDRHAMGRFILTGSQAFNLMKGASESLAGRCAILELEGMSAFELVAAGAVKSAPASRARLIARGQYPELWRDPGMRARDFYTAYLATYLERDLRQLINVSSLRDFERFVRVLAARSGCLLNKSEVAKDVGVSVKAIGDWLSALQASGIVALLEPWFQSFGKRLIRSPKLYFRDTGLLCFLLGIDEDSTEAELSRSPFAGALWEAYLFAEMRKLAAATGSSVRFWMYRDQRSREVDFVLERIGELSFVEAKWSEYPAASDVAVIRALAAELAASGGPMRPGPHYVLCRTREPHSLDGGVLATDELGIRGMLGIGETALRGSLEGS